MDSPVIPFYYFSLTIFLKSVLLFRIRNVSRDLLAVVIIVFCDLYYILSLSIVLET